MISTIAILFVAWIIFTVLVKLLRISASNAFIIAAVIVILQAGLGISPQDIWNQLMKFLEYLSQVGSNQ